MGPKKITEMFRRFEAANPEPTTELEYGSPFQLLVAVILSAQATDKGVNIATRKLFKAAPDAAAMAALGVEGMERFINTIGLFRNKAKNVVATAQTIAERFDGQVSNSREVLEALPGVGRKTANVVLNTIFGEPTMAVDTHIFRLSNRTGLAPGKDVREVEDKLLKRVPKAESEAVATPRPSRPCSFCLLIKIIQVAHCCVLVARLSNT